MSRIVTILPKGEGFSPQQFGAIALCVHDFARFSRYGAEIQVVGGMDSKGFDAVRYTPTPPARWYENRTRAYARGCAAIINREGAELVEIHNRPVLVRMIAGKTSARLALHLHNDPQEMEGARTPEARLQLLEHCAGIYCVSNYIRDRFMEGLPQEAANKVYVIHNGIEIPQGLPEKEKCILFAGRMTEGKGALLLAHALRNALPRLPGWRAVLIGSRRHEAGRDPTPHEEEIAEILKPLGARVEMPGFLGYPETLEHFARASIAVVPSVWQEPFGRTAIEAMAYGAALISSGRGALQEVTHDRALTVLEMTPEALAHAIVTLARYDNIRGTYQMRGRERARLFSIDLRTRKLDEARDRILSAA